MFKCSVFLGEKKFFCLCCHLMAKVVIRVILQGLIKIYTRKKQKMRSHSKYELCLAHVLTFSFLFYNLNLSHLFDSQFYILEEMYHGFLVAFLTFLGSFWTR